MKLMIVASLLLAGLLVLPALSSVADEQAARESGHGDPFAPADNQKADERENIPSFPPSSELVEGIVIESIPQDFNGMVNCSNCLLDGYCRLDGVCPNGAVLPEGLNGTITCGNETCRIKGAIPVSRV